MVLSICLNALLSLSLGEASESSSTPAPVTNEVPSISRDSLTLPATSGVSGKTTVEATPFAPPFPQRDDIFQPPNHNKGLTKSQREEVRTEVILKGFVNVEGVKALLSINGKVTSLGTGETESGIEIIEVSPPLVRLQRGKVRWTETLYGNP